MVNSLQYVAIPPLFHKIEKITRNKLLFIGSTVAHEPSIGVHGIHIPGSIPASLLLGIHI